MDCTAPGQFSAERLLAFAGGERDEALAAHLPSCAACTEALAGYAAAEHALRARLYRSDCVTTMELGELALDLLQPERATIVRAHLAGCPRCGVEFAGLRDALQTDPLLDLVPRPSPLRRLIARLLSTPAEVMAYGMVDAATHNPTRTYEAEGIRVSLTLAREEGDAVHRWTLHGMMVESDAESISPPGTARLLLNGQLISESRIDDLGTFVIVGLSAGIYDLELRLAGGLIALEALPVGGEWEPQRD
jgi:hypothetical protein